MKWKEKTTGQIHKAYKDVLIDLQRQRELSLQLISSINETLQEVRQHLEQVMEIKGYLIFLIQKLVVKV